MNGYILVSFTWGYWEETREILAGIKGVKKVTEVTQLPEESSKSYDFILEVEAPNRLRMLMLADEVRNASPRISRVDLYVWGT